MAKLSKMSIQELKQEKHETELHVSRLKREYAELGAKITSNQNRIKTLEAEILKRKQTKPLTITDHAILRYLERVEGIDVEVVKKALVGQQVLDQVSALGGDGVYPSEDGTCQIRVSNSVVVTVLV